MANWMVENLKFSVKQPVEAIVTKNELQRLALLCKSEVDAMGRIAAGILRLLKLEKSIGRAAMDQLSNVGSEGFDKIFSPDKASRCSSPASMGFSPSSHLVNETPRVMATSTVASLEEAVIDSQANCATLMSTFSSSESTIEYLTAVKKLKEKLENMQELVAQLRRQM